MTSVRLSANVEMELDRLSLLTRRPKSFYIREAIDRYLEQVRKRRIFRTPMKKTAKKTRAGQAKKTKHYDPLGHLVGKFTFGDGSPTNAALTHNDIYDF